MLSKEKSVAPFFLAQPSSSDKLQVFFVAVCRVAGSDSSGSQSQNDGEGSSQQSGEQRSLSISLARVTEAGLSHCKVRVQSDSMDLASEMVQDLCRHLGVAELESEADFPAELAQFEEVIKVVADCNDARIRLAADMADDSQRVKVGHSYKSKCSRQRLRIWLVVPVCVCSRW